MTLEGPDGPDEDAADLVVSADGIHSRIRAALFPDHPGPAYAGYVTWRGLVAAEAVPRGSRDLGITESWAGATPPQALLRHDIYHLKPPLPRYHAGRVVLLGDAAHALTPTSAREAARRWRTP